jgi:DNA-binding response OmpR family regulator
MMKGRNILIVDDEPDIVAYIKAVLESHNFIPHMADNAEDGFEMVRKIEPDLICLDIMMPDESGISMYARLRKTEKYNSIPVIIISGVEQEGEFDFRKFISDNKIPPPNHYLEKPINVDNFVGIIKRLISAPEKERKER